MDIFIINKSEFENIEDNILKKFQHKNFTDTNKLKEHCLSYFMLDKILKENFNIENRKLEFINNKPYLVSGNLFFSITHSSDYIVIGISKNECGIDIEIIKERDFQSISKRMNFVSSSLEEFYKNWTKFEAEYKLGIASKSYIQQAYKNYMITAVSCDNNEIFSFYVQNGKNFSNL